MEQWTCIGGVKLDLPCRLFNGCVLPLATPVNFIEKNCVRVLCLIDRDDGK